MHPATADHLHRKLEETRHGHDEHARREAERNEIDNIRYATDQIAHHRQEIAKLQQQYLDSDMGCQRPPAPAARYACRPAHDVYAPVRACSPGRKRIHLWQMRSK